MKFKSGTCIAAVKTKNGKILMAGDRRISGTGPYFDAPIPKIYKKQQQNMLIGGCGDYELIVKLAGVFQPPKNESDDVLEYMVIRFSRAIESFLKSLPGMIDEHKIVRLSDDECSLLVVCNRQLFIIDIPSSEVSPERFPYFRVWVNPVPLPFAIGSGADFIYPLLLEEKNEIGYNTEERLRSAMELTAKVDSYVGGTIDIIGVR